LESEEMWNSNELSYNIFKNFHNYKGIAPLIEDPEWLENNLEDILSQLSSTRYVS
jgi:hypothetical protein